MGSLQGWGAGARAAGAVLALGYLLGLVRGPLPAVAGALALITLGRCAASTGSDDLVLGAALAVSVGALQVGALRWETLDLAELRGAQAVLGPTVLVGPETAAAATLVAAVAGVAALSVWLATARRSDGDAPSPVVRALWFAEAAVGALALVTVFWSVAVPRGSFGGGSGALALAGWAVAVAATAGAALAGATYLERAWRSRGWILAVSGAAVPAAAIAVTAVAP